MKYLLLIFSFLQLAAITLAHESRPAYLELKQTGEDAYEMIWKVPARGDQMRLGIYVRLPEDCRSTSLLRASFAESSYVERSNFVREGGLGGAEIFIEGLSSTMTEALVRIVRLDGGVETTRLTPDSPSFVVKDEATTLGVVRTYTILGIQHIWKGVDHLLFVACLILVAGTWRRIMVTITGFTVAHSITLGMAALNVIRVPIAPTEACIALSIVFLATEIFRERKETFTWRYPILVSASFGLLHGFGFASALGEIGLPRTEVAAALLFFNVGVEIGQIAFVLAVIALVALLKRFRESMDAFPKALSQPIVRQATVYTVGGLASFWLLQRIAGFWV